MKVHLNLQTSALILYYVAIMLQFSFISFAKHYSWNSSFKSSLPYSNIYIQCPRFCYVCCHWSY